MKSQKQFLLFALLVGIAGTAYSQSPFRNLNFEQAKVIPQEGNPFYPYAVAATNAIPSWIPRTGFWEDDWIGYDANALDSPFISIHDTNSQVSDVVLEGEYTLVLGSRYYITGVYYEVWIAQVGWVPLSAKSIRFLSGYFTGVRVSFAGHDIPITIIGPSPRGLGYQWGGNLAQFAGVSGELRFSGGGSLDNIEFSSETISVPSPALSEPRFRSDGKFEFKFDKPYGTSYTVQVSTNFTAWATLSNVPAGFFPPVTIIDQTASNAAARFYRAVWP